MNIILLGAPGSGKGTQSDQIVKKFNLPHISTGDIFRKNIKENTPLGIKAKSYINEGQLVPDSVVIEIVKDRLQEKDCEKGFLLDGFPRTVFQAQELDKFAVVDAVINLEMDSSTLLYRLSGRRICQKCGNTTHTEFLKDNKKCDCGGDFIQRDDDKEETVKKRLKVYEAQTKPLIEYYRSNGKLKVINAGRDRKYVSQDVIKVLEAL